VSAAETNEILEELGLPVPKTLADYHRLVDRLNALIDKVGDDETHPLAGTLDRMGELIEEFEHQHIHELIENYGFARAVGSPRWKGPENCSQWPGSF
jgi:HTH-type transcriptional regulator/antitoxin HigA